MILPVFFLWHLVTDATVLLNINTTVAESTVLPCSLSTTTPIFTSSLRFYWQDDRDYVLYSFNKGKEMPEHVKHLYRERITAFQQDMIRGNISVKVKNTTLEDNLRVFRAFADNRGPGTDSHVIGQTCQMTLHVSGKDGINAELSCAKPAAASYYEATSICMQILLKTDIKKKILSMPEVFIKMLLSPQQWQNSFKRSHNRAGSTFAVFFKLLTVWRLQNYWMWYIYSPPRLSIMIK